MDKSDVAAYSTESEYWKPQGIQPILSGVQSQVGGGCIFFLYYKGNVMYLAIGPENNNQFFMRSVNPTFKAQNNRSGRCV